MGRSSAKLVGATLGEVIVGLAIFAMMTLAVVGVLIQTAHLDTKDTQLTETAFLADNLIERRVSDAREYENYRKLLSTPVGEYWVLGENRPDGLHEEYIYRVDVTELNPAIKRLVVSVYHRDADFPVPTVDFQQGQAGRALSLGTLINEPAR